MGEEKKSQALFLIAYHLSLITEKRMLEVKEMARGEMLALLLRVGYGHLGCARDGHPYVVPMNFAYDSRDIYFFTTEGTKTEFMAANHEVCFQVEEVTDALHWRSVMLTGRAQR